LQYTYDTGANLRKVESLCGTGSNETFYTLGTLTALGQVASYTNGNGVVCAYTYFANSKRLDRMRNDKGASPLQNLNYTYDKVSNIKSITDGVYSGSSGGALSSISYDDLHRLTSYTWNSTTYNFSYSSIGNITVNPEFGAGSYTYGSSKPHAVTAANGKTYSYDACGNMTNRNGVALLYDEENQLKQVNNTDGSVVTFGYSDGGARLWEQVTSSNQVTKTTVWIGGIYEIKDGKTLCHVIADGRRVATFEPVSPLCAWLQNTPVIREVYAFAKTATTWPLQDGRAPLTATLIPLLGILTASVFSRWRGRLACGRSRRRFFNREWTRMHAKPWRARLLPSRWCSGRRPGGISRRSDILVATGHWGFGASLRRRYSRLDLRSYPRWMQLINVVLTVALFVAVTPTQVNAQTYDPVFYYYHGDHLGSSNVMTDRNGELVQHYEYTAFGKERFVDNSQAFSVSHRYTGQIFDDATGLYYYNARYYDPELARFIQADTVVASPSDPQTLNRYTYVRNNPLIYVDPSGHIFGIDDIIVAFLVTVAIGAAVSGVASAISAAATGGNIGQAFASGLISGALTSAGGFLGGPVGAVIGAAAGGAINTARLGGSASEIAVSAAVAGISTAAGLGAANFAGKYISDNVFAQGLAAVTAGSVIGGAASEATGGNFAQGAAAGAISSGVGFGANQAFKAYQQSQQQKAQAQQQESLNTSQPQQLSPNQLGTIGEQLSGADAENVKVQIESYTQTAKYRVLDRETPTFIEETKYVRVLSITGRTRYQITDMAHYASVNGKTFYLAVRNTTIIQDPYGVITEHNIVVRATLPYPPP
jgi:RHS repeat-associated protein